MRESTTLDFTTDIDDLISGVSYSTYDVVDHRHPIVSVGDLPNTGIKKKKFKKNTILPVDYVAPCSNTDLDSCSNTDLDSCSNTDSLNDIFDDYYEIRCEPDANIDFTNSETDVSPCVTFNEFETLPDISSCVNFGEFETLDEIEEYIKGSVDTNNEFTKTHEEICKIFYERDDTEREDLKREISERDYSNESFCAYCKSHQVLPDFEIYNFMDKHLMTDSNITKKYLIMIFRLRPDIFFNYDVLSNKHLRKYILSYLRMNNISIEHDGACTDVDKVCKFDLGDPREMFFRNTKIMNQYYSKVFGSVNAYVYENLFHQPNLKFEDYLKCDSCKNYMCPKHIYLSNCYFGTCNYCKVRNWSICGWCKPGFNEYFACKYLHKH
jgi:hypothetical protein